MEIRGCSALVTGAGRGIGRALALALCHEGARVTVVSRTASELHSLATEAGGNCLPCPGDLLDPAFCRVAVDRAVAAHGGLQVLVNNAGAGLFRSFAETTDEEWDRLFGLNLTAVFRLTRAALPHLAKAGGHVLNISSLAGTNPIAGLSAYCASKAALDHLSACLMLEVREKGVKVSVIAPGSVDTSFGGGPRGDTSWMLRAEDVAQTALDLLRMRDGAHSSRVEMRPARPQKR